MKQVILIILMTASMSTAFGQKMNLPKMEFYIKSIDEDSIKNLGPHGATSFSGGSAFSVSRGYLLNLIEQLLDTKRVRYNTTIFNPTLEIACKGVYLDPSVILSLLGTMYFFTISETEETVETWVLKLEQADKLKITPTKENTYRGAYLDIENGMWHAGGVPLSQLRNTLSFMLKEPVEMDDATNEEYSFEIPIEENADKLNAFLIEHYGIRLVREHRKVIYHLVTFG